MDYPISKRLVIKPYIIDDNAALQIFLRDNKADLMHLLPKWAPDVLSDNNMLEYIKKLQAGWLLKNYLTFGIWLKGHPIIVGEIVLFKINWQLSELEIGFYLTKNYQNLGLMSEALSAVTEYTFEQLKILEIHAECDIKNRAAHHVLKKCNYSTKCTSDQSVQFSKHAG